MRLGEIFMQLGGIFLHLGEKLVEVTQQVPAVGEGAWGAWHSVGARKGVSSKNV